MAEQKLPKLPNQRNINSLTTRIIPTLAINSANVGMPRR
jgi:hypothetical protein